MLVSPEKPSTVLQKVLVLLHSQVLPSLPMLLKSLRCPIRASRLMINRPYTQLFTQIYLYIHYRNKKIIIVDGFLMNVASQ